jgi:multiple antibiotic resistance protein
MAYWHNLLTMTVNLLAIIDPPGAIPIFIAVTEGWRPAARARTARIVGMTIFVVLTLAAFAGDAILNFFGISIAAFLVGGGAILFILAVAMVQARESPIRQTPGEFMEAAQSSEQYSSGVVPLAVPLLAGPGAISSIIISAHEAASPLRVLLELELPIFLISLTTWVVFQLANPIAQRLGRIGINIITRIMGLILAAIAVEFIARGLKGLFPALG